MTNAAKELNRVMNLFGLDEQPIAGLLDLAKPLSDTQRQVEDILTPECYHRRGDKECGHQFPAWFCRKAYPAARAFLRLAYRVRLAKEPQMRWCAYACSLERLVRRCSLERLVRREARPRT